MATERARAIRNVFISNTDKLRRELMIEVKDLNSELISRCLISDAVLREQDIDTTLQEIRGRLHNQEVAEETFQGFVKAVNEISSKSHLAKQMLQALDAQCPTPLPGTQHEDILVEVAKLSSNTTENFSSDKATGSSILSIDDLVMVKRFLKYFNDWQSLGLELGLLYPRLERIEEEQRGDVNKCTMKMLAAWLQRQDNVSQVGVPSWSVLQTALKNIGENELADTVTNQLVHHD